MTTLEGRRAEACTSAVELSRTADVLLAAASQLRSQSKELRIVAAQIRHEHARRTVMRSPVEVFTAPLFTAPLFTVVGIVDGVARQARYWPGHVDFDSEVLERAEVVVAMGERFSLPGSNELVVEAAIDGPPLAVLLTVMRAFSRVISVDLSEKIFGHVDRRRR